MKHYCYVYYDENWQAYYVGKGSYHRKNYRHDSIPVPENNFIQSFHFDNDWRAWECEIELIAFWGRQCDGGSLMNKSSGGPGGHTGVITSQETRDKLSKALKGRPAPWRQGSRASDETKRKMSEAQKGKPKSPEHRKKLAEHLTRLNKNRKKK